MAEGSLATASPPAPALPSDSISSIDSSSSLLTTSISASLSFPPESFEEQRLWDSESKERTNDEYDRIVLSFDHPNAEASPLRRTHPYLVHSSQLNKVDRRLILIGYLMSPETVRRTFRAFLTHWTLLTGVQCRRSQQLWRADKDRKYYIRATNLSRASFKGVPDLHSETGRSADKQPPFHQRASTPRLYAMASSSQNINQPPKYTAADVTLASNGKVICPRCFSENGGNAANLIAQHS
ncbi:hypothetical protein C8J56DRAFT_1112549 [Mycena floridula]|nr:hypothetical protein C8J56DRAFT_1112549 [Mycena floridula]